MPTKKRRPSSGKNRKKHKHPISAARAAPASRNRRVRGGRDKVQDVRAELGYASLPGLFSVPDSIPVTWLKFLIGLLLFPLCWISTEAFFISFNQVSEGFWRSQQLWFFGIGGAMGLVLFASAGRGKALLYLYVLGHEWTHAFFALLCGGRVEKIHVAAAGGHILTNKNNFLISLSPYFVPFYTVLALAGYALAEFFFEFGQGHQRVLFALIGLTWTFHFTFTIQMILRNQPDLKHNGTFFSLTLIYLINLVVIAGFTILASPGLSARAFSTTWLSQCYTLPERVMAAFERIGAAW